MKQDNLTTLKKRAFQALHLIFLLTIVSTIVLATDPERFCAVSGIPLFINAQHPKGVEAILILWVIGSALAVATSRKRIYTYSHETGTILWDEQLRDTAVRWFYMITLPQLLLGIYFDLYIYTIRLGNLLGILMYVVKLACAIYVGYAIHKAK